MKFCPYCGDLLDRIVVGYCSSCGKPILKKKYRKRFLEENDYPDSQNHAIKAEKSHKHKNKRTDNYDGYYDDVMPADQGKQIETRNKELQKKIILLAVGFVLVVALCVALMYILQFYRL